MKKINTKQEHDNLIGQKLAAAYGYSDEQLIAEFDRIANEPDDLDNPQEKMPEGGFERLLAKLREEPVEERVEKKNVKVIRLKQMVKMAILVAALGSMVLSSGIAASGKRKFEYMLQNSGGENRTVWNNTEAMNTESLELEAYQKIKEELGIDVLCLTYMPKGMKFTKMIIDNGCARLEFIYDNKYVYFFQTLYDVDSSGNTTSDKNGKEVVHNRKIDLDLLIGQEVRVGGEIELSTEFVLGKAYYYLEGTMDKEIFVEMVKGINFFE